MPGSEKILLERDGPVAVITLNDPATLNALTVDFLRAYRALLESLAEDQEIRVIILTGAGKAFVAGADIAYMRGLSPSQALKYAKDTVECYRLMEDMDQIFIAAVNGYALGVGCGQALSCDLRIASSKARFGLPEVSLGIFPAGGGTQRLSRLVGEAAAKELIFTAQTIDAQRARDLGLVSAVAEPDALMDEAQALADKVLRNSMSAVALAKKSMNRGRQMGMDAAITQDQSLFGVCFGSPDQLEGMGAFLEKRKPVFQHQTLQNRRRESRELSH